MSLFSSFKVSERETRRRETAIDASVVTILPLFLLNVFKFDFHVTRPVFQRFNFTERLFYKFRSLLGMASVLSSFFQRDPKSQFPYDIPGAEEHFFDRVSIGNSFKKVSFCIFSCSMNIFNKYCRLNPVNSQQSSGTTEVQR